MSRRTVVAGAAWAVPAVVAVNTLPAWAASPHDALVCPSGRTTTIGAGRLLSGSILGINLDTLAAVNGIKVNNDGAGVVSHESWGTPNAISASGVPGDAYAFVNALDVAAINGLLAINAAIKLNADGANLGVVNQYGRAVQNGYSRGASGAVSETGAVQTNLGSGSNELATVDLAHLVHTIGGIDIGPITNLKLSIGALWGQAEWDACPARESLSRTYLIAYVRVALISPALQNAVSTVTSVVNTLQTAVNGVTSITTLTLSELGAALGAVLSGLGFGAPTVSVTATIDLTAVTTAITTPVTSSNGLVNIAPADGLVTVDLGAALGGLNGQAPNTELLITAATVSSITSAVTSAVNDLWYANVKTLVNQAIDAVKVTATITVPISLTTSPLGLPVTVQLGNVVIKVTNASLASLLNGTATVDTSGTSLVGLPVGNFLQPIINAVVAEVLPDLGTAIQNLISPNWTAAQTAVDAVATQLETLFNALQGTNVLSLVVNAQTDRVSPVPSFPQYEVAALKLQVVKNLASGVVAMLGRAGVGPNGSWVA